MGELDVGGPQVLDEDRRGRAVGGPHVLDVGADWPLHRVVVDHQIHFVEVLLEERGLHVHHGYPVELVDAPGTDFLDVDLEDLAHGEVLGPGDGAKGTYRGGAAGAPEQNPEGQRRRDGVRVGIVLHEDQDAVRPLEVGTNALGAGPLAGAVHCRLDHPLAEHGERYHGRAWQGTVVVTHHEKWRLGDRRAHSRHDAPEALRPRGNDHRATTALERATDELGIGQVAPQLPSLGQARAAARRIDEIDGVLAREARASHQVWEQVVGADQYRSHLASIVDPGRGPAKSKLTLPPIGLAARADAGPKTPGQEPGFALDGFAGSRQAAAEAAERFPEGDAGPGDLLGYFLAVPRIRERPT